MIITAYEFYRSKLSDKIRRVQLIEIGTALTIAFLIKNNSTTLLSVEV